MPSLKLLQSYLVNRKQENTNEQFSQFVLRIFLEDGNDPFLDLLISYLLVSNFGTASYTDENIPSYSGIHIKEVIPNLENVSEISKWFYENYMEANSGKFHLLTNENFQSAERKVDDNMISNSKCKKLLTLSCIML